jgi:PIN domain nuclease of toxin-antitoxin system
MELAVTDTNPLVWYAKGERRRLGKAARRLFERADAGRAAIYVPVMVLVEIGDMTRRGLVRVPGGLTAFAEGLFSTRRFFAADLTIAVVLRAEALYAIRERGDRLIAATAAELDLPLITRDAAIAEAGVATIW